MKVEKSRKFVRMVSLYSVIHCGVVGNMQASHVCAPGSIPGDGVFFEYKIKGREREGDR